MAEPFAMTQPAISAPKVLERAPVSQATRSDAAGDEAARLAEATEWLERYRKLWQGRLRSTTCSRS